MRRGAFALIAVATLLLFAGPVSAQTYPVQTGTLVASDTTVSPGEAVRVQGSGFTPGGSVVVTIESEPVTLATIDADGGGAIDTTVTIPSNFEPGTHTLKATGPAPGGGTLVLSQSVTVLGADDEAPPSSLARTGAAIAGLGAIGLGSFGIGIALWKSAGRTRARHS